MNVTAIFSFLVRPAKGQDPQPHIGGTEIPLKGNLHRLLSRQFANATTECNIDIAFLPDSGGKQTNPCRNEMIAFLRTPQLEHARALAARLQRVTTHRSGLALLFVMVGINRTSTRAYICRFPADYGIIAEELQKSLRVELLEKVFMKNALAYKAVAFEGTSFDSDFWLGRAIDRQINNASVALSEYWIRDFLLSDFQTTSATGTRRLAFALKQTIDTTSDLDIKEELAAAVRLVRALDKQPITLQNIAERFCLSKKTAAAVLEQLDSPLLKFDRFVFSSDEFVKHVGFRSLSIDNGAMLLAPCATFDKCFTRKRIDGSAKRFEFSTSGTVVNHRLRSKS